MAEYGLLPFGSPIPNVPHAISVSLPKWENVLTWVAKRPGSAVPEVMKTGYPRFFVHRKIRELAAMCLDKVRSTSALAGDFATEAFLFPSARAAYEGHDHVLQMARRQGTEAEALSSNATIIHFLVRDPASPEERCPELHALIVPTGIYQIALGFWRRGGFGISSRYACMVFELLSGGSSLVIVSKNRDSPSWLNIFPGASEQKYVIRERISDLLNGGDGTGTGGGVVKPTDVFLYPNGISAVWHAEEMGRILFDPDLKVVSFGYIYVCCLHLHKLWGEGSIMLRSEDLLTELSELLKTTRISILFAETPNNAMLKTPNLAEIRKLADQHGFLVVVDDTVGGFANVDVLPYADIVCSSLTKLFSGGADVTGGSLVLNPGSKNYSTLQSLMERLYFDDYFSEDAALMEHNSRDYMSRVRTTNANGVEVAEFLRSRSMAGNADDPSSHSKMVIKDVFYPKWLSRSNFEMIRRHSSTPVDSFGYLMTLTFTTVAASKAFYGALKYAKGPTIGANFTLATPYTILVHNEELAWAAQFGLEEGMIRISVGTENQEILLGWIKEALEEAEKTLEDTV